MKESEILDNMQLEVWFQQEGFLADLTPVDGKKSKNSNWVTFEHTQREWFERFHANKYRALYELGFLNKEEWMNLAVGFLCKLSREFIVLLSSNPDIEVMRGETEFPLDEDIVSKLSDAVPFANGAEYVNKVWILSVWKKLFECFQSDIASYTGTVAEYFMERNSMMGVAGRIYFHLVESKDDEYPFAFMATYSTRPSKSKRAVHTPLKHALLEFKKDRDKLLSLMSSVVKAAEGSALISDFMESGELFSALRFTEKDAYTFLSEIPVYEKAGIMCRVPDWWRRKTNSIHLSVSVGKKEPSGVGADALLDFSPTLLIDGEELTKKELQEFLSMAEGLVNYKGKWVEINKEKLSAALAAFEKAQKLAIGGQISIAEAMRMEMTLNKETVKESQLVECSVTNGQWMKELKDKLLNPTVQKCEMELHGFKAVLRPYQSAGYQWLSMMGQVGLGACLADDMGLGKTVQVIAYLESVRLLRGGYCLLIVPASLLGNWIRELERFAPELSFQVLHKSFNGNQETSFHDDKFLCITTYAMATRTEDLATRRWDVMILDEAQAIKNAGTKQSKAIKAIPAAVRIAMTGTPIENHLSDLWSLFDFLNPGLLGSAKEFTNFTKQLSDENVGYHSLRKVVTPFILRRMKTDRSIISDLPDKIELMDYAGLSKKQTVLYKKLVDELSVKLSTTEGIDRKGLVLASIMKFKQICNHPDQYLGLEEYKKDASGKFERLEQICETIYEKRERVLVFTQFKEMTEPLSDFLEQIFHRKGMVLHGGTSIKKRSEMVELFNGEDYIPYMVLSLKAGGVGLNLTAANHVVHFDRWWNPAVENQATDRAFRIGQTKQVMVHKFVTEGTIEEKIDDMIAKKQKLAGDILGVSSGETWITELSNEELIGLFKLGGGIA